MTETMTPAPAVGAKNLQMLHLNDVRICGRLTEEPKSRSTKNGRTVLHFNVAVNRRYKDAQGEWHDETSFVPATVWNTLADECQKRLHKGSPIYVEGRLRGESWKAKDGQTRQALKIDVSKVRFLAKGKDKGQSGDGPTSVA